VRTGKQLRSGSHAQRCVSCSGALAASDRFCGACGEPVRVRSGDVAVERSGRSRLRGRVVWGLLVGGVIAGVAFLLLPSSPAPGGPESTESSQAASVRLSDVGWPGADEGSAAGTLRYLEGDGRVLDGFYEATDPLFDVAGTDSDTPTRCGEIAGQLDDRVSSRELLDVAGAIPDEVLARLTLNTHAARSAALVHCVRGDFVAMSDDLTGARQLRDLVDQRHQELEDAAR